MAKDDTRPLDAGALADLLESGLIDLQDCYQSDEGAVLQLPDYPQHFLELAPND